MWTYYVGFPVNRLVAWLRLESGQAMAEYAFLLAFIAIVVAVAAGLLGVAITGNYDEVADCVTNANC